MKNKNSRQAGQDRTIAGQTGSRNKPRIMLMVPSLHQGGLENVCVQTARLLQPYYEVTLLIFTGKDPFFDVSGLDVVNLKLPALDGTWNKAVNLVKRVAAIRRIKRERKIELTYSFGSTANLSNVLSRVNDKIVTGFRSSVDVENVRRVKLFCRGSDLVICCSADLARVLGKRFGYHNTAVLYNPLDADGVRGKIEDSPDAAGAVPFSGNTQGRVLVNVGREDDYKGYWHLIKALYLLHNGAAEIGSAQENKTESPGASGTGQEDNEESVKNQAFNCDNEESVKNQPLNCGSSAFADVKLSLIGSGSYTAYRKLVAELGIADAVAFAGAHTNPFPYLKNATAYILSSNHEGFPNALVEAMACGLPVMACDCMSGPREILCSREEYEQISRRHPAGTSIRKPVFASYGYLVPNMSDDKDTDPSHITKEDRKLARELAVFLEDKERLQEYGQAARRRSEVYSYDTYTRRLRKILERVRES